MCLGFLLFFFFNDTATTEIYTLSLHDALPISNGRRTVRPPCSNSISCSPEPSRSTALTVAGKSLKGVLGDRKSTRLNSSHLVISYAVFCLKKKKKHRTVSCVRH